MKIWVIGRHYPAINNRMRGSFEIEQAKMLARGGHEVIYIAVVFHPYKKIRNWGFSIWKEDGITVCGYSQFYFPEKMNLKMGKFRTIVFRKAMKKVEKRVGLPDIIHVHYPIMIADPNVILSYQSKGCAIVCTEHWTSVQTKNINDSEKKKLKKFVDGADAFICVGEPLRKSVEELTHTNRKIVVIPNVVEFIFHPREKNDKIGFEFITAGRLVKNKQIDKVIKAFADVVKSKTDAVLTIIGDGEEKEKLQEITASLNIEDRVHFTGTQPREKVAKMIAHADCLICYSNLETFGVPIIEAWASGIPVISSDALGFSEYWKEGLGYIVNQNNLDELIDKMKRVIDEINTYDPMVLHRYAIQHFSEESVIEQLEEVYSKSTTGRKIS